MAVTKDDLGMMLADVRPGEGASVSHDDFETIFPRGHGAKDMQAEAYGCARALGFKIDDRPEDGAVWSQRFAW